MSIQLPVLIWTVICFCVFSFIMYKLIFKPVLGIMDARKNKIDAAKIRAEERERSVSEERERLAAKRAEERRIAEEQSRAEYARLKEQLDADLRRAEEASEEEFRSAQSLIESEAVKAEEKARAGLDPLVSAFAESIVS
ncbi:MAG: hypothetical protein J5793_03135 [Clostridia bacterium]|nr:hypothetical protein [Clostridia bacterium]